MWYRIKLAIINFWWSLKDRTENQAPEVQAPVSEEPTEQLPDTDHPTRGTVKLGIVIGHTKDSSGATLAEPYGYPEYTYNGWVAKSAQDYAKKYKGLIVQLFYRDGVGIAGAYANAIAAGCDAVIELHFNAYNEKVKGTETLCSFKADDIEFAHIVQKGMINLFKREGKEDRGVLTISRSDRGGQSCHAFPNGVNCLVEPFFGDNKEEAKMAMDMKDQYAAQLIESVVLWAKKKDLLS